MATSSSMSGRPRPSRKSKFEEILAMKTKQSIEEFKAEMKQFDADSRGLRYEDEETQKKQNEHLITYRRAITMLARLPRDISDEDADTLCFPGDHRILEENMRKFVVFMWQISIPETLSGQEGKDLYAELVSYRSSLLFWAERTYDLRGASTPDSDRLRHNFTQTLRYVHATFPTAQTTECRAIAFPDMDTPYVMSVTYTDTYPGESPRTEKVEKCQLCLDDGTVSKCDRDRLWPSGRPHEEHMQGEFHTQYSQLVRKFRLEHEKQIKQTYGMDILWSCPYCPDNGQDYPGITSMVKHIITSDAANTSQEHDAQKIKDGWYDDSFYGSVPVDTNQSQVVHQSQIASTVAHDDDHRTQDIRESQSRQPAPLHTAKTTASGDGPRAPEDELQRAHESLPPRLRILDFRATDPQLYFFKKTIAHPQNRDAPVMTEDGSAAVKHEGSGIIVKLEETEAVAKLGDSSDDLCVRKLESLEVEGRRSKRRRLF